MPPFRYKGKLVSEKQYLKFKKQSDVGKNNVRRRVVPEINHEVEVEGKRINITELGTRMVDLGHIAQQLFCSCGKHLFFENITEEAHFGFASMIKIRCEDCLQLNKVYTSKIHKDKHGKNAFDINTKAALGNFGFKDCIIFF